jgi:hypothetical protein
VRGPHRRAPKHGSTETRTGDDVKRTTEIVRSSTRRQTNVTTGTNLRYRNRSRTAHDNAEVELKNHRKNQQLGEERETRRPTLLRAGKHSGEEQHHGVRLQLSLG